MKRCVLATRHFEQVIRADTQSFTASVVKLTLRPGAVRQAPSKTMRQLVIASPGQHPVPLTNRAEPEPAGSRLRHERPEVDGYVRGLGEELPVRA